MTDDDELAAAVRRRRVHGMTEQYVHTDVSQNFRLSELEAAWLRLVLPDLAAGNERRRAIAAAYRAAAPGAAVARRPPPPRVPPVRGAGDRPRRLARRAGRSRRGHGRALPAGPHPAAGLRRRSAAQPCPEAEAWAASCTSLPCFPELTDDEVATVISALERA